MTRWNWPVTGFGSQNEHLVHFGLGDVTAVDSLVVRWPSGREDVHTDVPLRRLWVVREGAPLSAESDEP